MQPNLTIKRRTFLKASLQASGAMLIHFNLIAMANTAHRSEGHFIPNGWLEITPDNRFIFTLDKAELGQNVITSLTAIIAEELDMDLNQLEVQFPTLSSTPANPLYKPSWGTAGSSSVRSLWQPLRHAGAATRALFNAAAAQYWQVPENEISHRNGLVYANGTNKQLRYADLLEATANVDTPDYQLKNPADLKQIGKSLRRYDAKEKVTGAARFGIDTRVPGQKYSTLVRSPVYGGKPAEFDASKALAQPGVIDVVKISNGVAIVAEGYWQAQTARKLLQVEWKTKEPGEALNDALIQESLQQAFMRPGLIARDKGDAKSFPLQPEKTANTNTISAEYRVPFLAHAPMEPMNCTAWFHDGICEVWAPTQRPPLAVSTAAKAAGLLESEITLHTSFIGGGFGRRLAQDYVREVVEIARQVDYPVMLIWSREDDMQHGQFRPAMHCRFSAAIDEYQSIISLQAQLSSPGKQPSPKSVPVDINQRVKHYLRKFKQVIRDDYHQSYSGTAGLHDMPYEIGNFQVQAHYASLNLPTGAWRSVDHSYNTFFVESFIDELAHRAAADPYAFRVQHLEDSPRLVRTLNEVATLSNWNNAKQQNRHLGIACHSCFGSHVAQVAEVSVIKNKIRVHKVYCAIDCGLAIDPDGVVQQTESAIIFGLTAALYGEINWVNGGVKQSNFHDYPALRMDECPEIEVKIVSSEQSDPGGVGEVGTPCIAPAVANAVFAATGSRQRVLPLR